MTRTSRRTGIGFVVALLAVLPAFGAEVLFEQPLKLAPGGRLVLDADLGAVRVQGSDTDAPSVRVTSQDPGVGDDFRIEAAGDGREARVRVESLRGSYGSGFLAWLSGRKAPRLEIELIVPRRTDLDLKTRKGSVEVRDIVGDVVARTSGGSIRLDSLAGSVQARTSGGAVRLHALRGSADLATSGGSIRVEKVEGTVRAATSGGSIRAEDVSGALDVATSGGSIRLDGIRGPVSAVTSGGSISAALVDPSQGGTLKTSGGTVRVALPPGADLDLDAASGGGRVVVELPLSREDVAKRSVVRGALGSGGPKLVLRTSGGSVIVEALGGAD